MPILSIIIPCYNCADTLGEAVESCFSQGLNNFEIVMVDDKSTDNTKEVMQELASKHPEIKLFYHDKNKGGGATRNTAVEHSNSEVIFCLDSDDLLPKKTLSKMLAFMEEKKCDGVGIHKSIKFKGTNINDIEIVHTFGYAGEKIPFESLLQKDGVMCPLYSTFMFTKKAFDITGGYPINHGFDTQGFAWRFLMSGLVAYTCPEAEYLHRINFHQSYYLREYNKGNINYNWQRVLEEFIFAFSPEVQEMIINFNLRDTGNSIINKLNSFKNPWSKDIKDIVKFGNAKTYSKKLNFGMDEKLFLAMCENSKKTFKGIPRNGIRGFIQRGVKKVLNRFNLLFEIMKQRGFRFNLLFAFLLLKIKKLIKFHFNVKDFDKVPVDVVIVTTSKDYLLLETYLAALKDNLCQSINKIFLVSFPKEEIIDFCKSHNIIFIDERQVLGYGKEAIAYKVNGTDRSGWMLQQLIKLYADTFTETENFLSVCSDTILINKNSFIRGGKFIFFENEEWHEPYFKNFKKIFGYDTKNVLSFTSHMMIFNAKKLKLLRKELEVKNNMSWDKAYMSTMSDKEMSCISDYDTYANWVLYNFPEEVITEPLYNTSLKRGQLPFFKEILGDLKNKYNTVSFHSFIKD